MLTLHWTTICPAGESMHLAFVQAPLDPRRPEHTHDFYECFLVEGGRGRHVVGGQSDPLRTGQLHFIRPEHTHAFRSTAAEGLAFTNVAFAATAVESVLAHRPFMTNIWVRDKAPVRLDLDARQTGGFVALVSDVAGGPRDETDASFFLFGLARLLRPAEGVAADSGLPGWLRDALPVAAEPEHLKAGLSRLVRLCGRSQEHVNRTFRRHLGLTPTEWLNGARIRHARRLLETTQTPIIEIASDCGFDSLSYFHRCFKGSTGTTPLRYRRHAADIQSGR